MSGQENKTRKSLLKRLKSAFSDLDKCEEIELETAYRLGGKKVRVPFRQYPIQVNIGEGKNVFHLYPEVALTDPQDSGVAPGRYILVDPATYFSGVSGFYRLEDGDKLTLGKHITPASPFIDLPREVTSRTLSITNDGGTLIFKAHDPEITTCISPLIDPENRERLRAWRIDKLKRIKAIYGGPIERLPADTALEVITAVNALMENEPYRLAGRKGRPGGVLELPVTLPPVVVGDLHTRVDNLLTLLSQNGFLEAMEADAACLVIVGDAVHPDQGDDLADMNNSMLIMDLIFKLKLRFPGNLFYLRGNHDSFSGDIAKGGVPQGLLWEQALVRERGQAYRDAMARFYELLPFVACSKQFVACHAGPPTSPTDKTALIDIRKHPEIARELTNNRLKNATRVAGYGKSHLKKFRRMLGVAPETPVVVGHTPIGDHETLWENPSQLENHVIVYGSDPDRIGAMVGIEGKLFPIRYPSERLIPFVNAL